MGDVEVIIGIITWCVHFIIWELFKTMFAIGEWAGGVSQICYPVQLWVKSTIASNLDQSDKKYLINILLNMVQSAQCYPAFGGSIREIYLVNLLSNRKLHDPICYKFGFNLLSDGHLGSNSLSGIPIMPPHWELPLQVSKG